MIVKVSFTLNSMPFSNFDDIKFISTANNIQMIDNMKIDKYYHMELDIPFFVFHDSFVHKNHVFCER